MGLAAFQYHHRVTYAECTAGNHIYYSRYLDLLEAARGEFFRQLGAPLLRWQQQKIIFPVIECRMRYKAPARYDDLLVIEVRLAAVERVRLNFSYRVLLKSGTLLVEAETFHACTGLDEKPRRIPEELERLLKPYCE
jgi:acyl-CoA thioester hydrolase